MRPELLFPLFAEVGRIKGVGPRYAKLIGCWTKEAGVLNSIVFLWAYDDLAHRSQQRAKMAKDTEPKKL